MPRITLRDGTSNKLFNTDTQKVTSVNLAQHAMRYHIYDHKTKTATEHYVPASATEAAIITEIAKQRHGRLWTTCSWIAVKNSPVELWDASNYSRMVQKDLSSWWGDSVEVTGTSIRDVYYFSDGHMASTPESIGTFSYKGYSQRPLIYKGKAVASIFKIHSLDVLADNACVVYWLPKPWWEGFHSRFRGMPKDFPYPCGFSFSNWCQRAGHAKYNSGAIWLASMNQAQTVGSWSVGNLASYWLSRGTDILALQGIGVARNTKKVTTSDMRLLSATTHAPYGRVGTVCWDCGERLLERYSMCAECGITNSIAQSVDRSSLWCTLCGRGFRLCGCSTPNHVSMNVDGHNHQYMAIGRYLEQWQYGHGKEPF